MQQRAVAKYLPDAPFDILPFTLETLVAGGAGSLLPPGGFDTVFSMGVIYHRRDPVNHIQDLLKFLRPGGELALESLVIDEEYGEVLKPRDRYARMRNIWAIPSITTLKDWLSAAGLTSTEVADVSVTTPAEQRVTEWTFEQSLSDFLGSAKSPAYCRGPTRRRNGQYWFAGRAEASVILPAPWFPHCFPVFVE